MTELAHVTDSIEAPADAVWAVLTDFGHPQVLAPSIDRCVVTGEGIGAVRIVESSRGLSIHERLLECDEASYRFRYEILDSGDMPFDHVTSYCCTVILTPISDRNTGISWRSEGGIDGPIEPINAFLDTLYRQATDNIRQYLRAQD